MKIHCWGLIRISLQPELRTLVERSNLKSRIIKANDGKSFTWFLESEDLNFFRQKPIGTKKLVQILFVKNEANRFIPVELKSTVRPTSGWKRVFNMVFDGDIVTRFEILPDKFSYVVDIKPGEDAFMVGYNMSKVGRSFPSLDKLTN